MGYYTDFNLTITDRQGEYVTKYNDKYAAVYNRLADRFAEAIGISDALDRLTTEQYPNWKWYDYEKDMRSIAKDFPDFIFTLEGTGEDQGDIWVEQYYGEEWARSQAEFIPPNSNPLGY